MEENEWELNNMMNDGTMGQHASLYVEQYSGIFFEGGLPPLLLMMLLPKLIFYIIPKTLRFDQKPEKWKK